MWKTLVTQYNIEGKDLKCKKFSTKVHMWECGKKSVDNEDLSCGTGCGKTGM